MAWARVALASRGTQDAPRCWRAEGRNRRDAQPRVQNAYIRASTRGFQISSAGKPKQRIAGLSKPPAPSGTLRPRPQITLIMRGSRVRIPPSAWLSRAVFSLVPDRVGGPRVQTRTKRRWNARRTNVGLKKRAFPIRLTRLPPRTSSGSPACVSSSAGFLRGAEASVIAGDEARRAPTYPADLPFRCRQGVLPRGRRHVPELS
jgi:hypothetical protein